MLLSCSLELTGKPAPWHFACVGLLLAACGGSDRERAHRPDWVIHSRVVFVTADLRSERPPAPLGTFRLWCPYIIGDLYGAPSTGDFLRTTLHPDYTFEIDLNPSHDDLLRSLEPTEFSLAYLKIEPAEARIARLAPAVLQLEGIEALGATDFIDAASRERVLLIYMDRAARITGETVARGKHVRYDVRADAAGYFWIGRQLRHEPAGDTINYVAVKSPEHVLLAVAAPEVPSTPQRQ